MRLRRRVFSWLFVVVTVTTFTVYWFVRQAIDSHLQAAEQREFVEKFNHFESLAKWSLNGIDYWSADIAQWDMLADYLAGKENGFMQEALPDTSFMPGTNWRSAQYVLPKYVGFVGPQGELLRFAGYDLKTQRRVLTPPPGFMEIASTALRESSLKVADDVHTGFAKLDGDVYQFALRRISRSDGETLTPNYLLVLRIWGKRQVADLRAITGMNVSYDASAATAPSEAPQLEARANELLVRKSYLDFKRTPIFELRLEGERSNYQLGMKALNIFLLIIVGLFLVAMGALLVTFDTLVIRRIHSLNSSVQLAKDDNRAIETMQQSGTDELSQLSFEVKNLFTWLRDLADNDPLTKIPNRRAFFARASSLQANAKAGASGVVGALLIDLDHFKSVNDKYGHPQGDEVLRVVASILKRANGDKVGIGRFGGEEFVLFTWQQSHDEVIALAEKIRMQLEAMDVPLLSGAGQLKVTMSVGVAIAGFSDEVTAEHLLDRADAALYESKKSGRNRVTLAKPGLKAA